MRKKYDRMGSVVAAVNIVVPVFRKSSRDHLEMVDMCWKGEPISNFFTQEEIK